VSPGARLRALIAERGVVEAMACHNALTARLAAEAGFEALWASGFELAAAHGVPDAGVVSMAEHLAVCRQMAERTGGLVVADLDTGFGNAVNLTYAVEAYERAGVAAVVVEDKTFPKMTSLVPGGRQELARIEEYQGKLEAALAARRDPGLIVAARTEALIAGLGVDEALKRGEAYAEAGADLLLVHSKAPTSAEIEAFIGRWSGRVPLILVPTAFPSFGREAARASGKVAMVIWANQGLRAAVRAMRDTFAAVRAEGSAASVEDRIATLGDLLELQEMERVAELERRYLR
jgi:phosphoenolpyruvate phosphomutase